MWNMDQHWADALGQRPVTDLEGAPRMDENRGRSRVRTGSIKENDAVLGQGRLADMQGSKDLIRSHIWWQKRGGGNPSKHHSQGRKSGGCGSSWKLLEGSRPETRLGSKPLYPSSPSCSLCPAFSLLLHSGQGARTALAGSPTSFSPCSKDRMMGRGENPLCRAWGHKMYGAPKNSVIKLRIF